MEEWCCDIQVEHCCVNARPQMNIPRLSQQGVPEKIAEQAKIAFEVSQRGFKGDIAGTVVTSVNDPLHLSYCPRPSKPHCTKPPAALWRPFDKARAFARGLKLKSAAEWRKYCASGKKPADIPVTPHVVYADDGWSNWGDWLGTGNRRSGWRSFEKARAFVRRLKLKSNKAWRKYCASGRKPVDITTHPDRVYADDGWSDWGDWLGIGTVGNRLRQYR